MKRIGTGVILAAAAALLLGGCGPSGRELGGAVLIASAWTLALGMLVMWGLCRVHRRANPSLVFRGRPVVVGIVVCAVVGVVTAVVLSDTRALRYSAAVTFTHGLSYLTLLVVVWRVWFARAPERAFAWAWLPVAIVQLAPAVGAAAGLFEPPGWLTVLWLWPGYLGIPTAVVLALAFIEAAGLPASDAGPAP